MALVLILKFETETEVGVFFMKLFKNVGITSVENSTVASKPLSPPKIPAVIKTKNMAQRQLPSRNGPRLKLAIKPFNRPPAPPANLYAESITTLQTALRAILRKESLTKPSVEVRSRSPKAVTMEDSDAPVSREELYQSVENLCVHGHASKLYQDVREALNSGAKECTQKLLELVPHSAVSVQGEVYLNSMPDHASSHVFLSAMKRVYSEYLDYLSFVRSIFLYLDRTYLLQHPSRMMIWEAGVDYFKQRASPPYPPGNSHQKYYTLAQSTVHALLVQIINERNGEVVDRPLLRGNIAMLLAFGFFDTLFLTEFQQTSVEYFQAEGNKYIHSSSPTAFLERVQFRIAQAQDMQLYYLPSTANQQRMLVHTVEQHLFKPHVDTFLNKHLSHMLQQQEPSTEAQNLQDLKLLCILLKRIHALPQLKRAFISHSRNAADKIVQGPNQKEIIPNLLSFKKHLQSIPFFALHYDIFQDSLKAVLDHVLNSTEQRSRLMAEYLAKYMDLQLKSHKSLHTTDDTDAFLNQVLSLFRYLTSKDVFEAFYKRDLAKRLLLNKSASIDVEKSFLSKLKTECGTAYTAKMEGMFKDVELSRDVMNTFTGNASSNSDVVKPSRLDVQILTTGYWPVYPQFSSIRLPSQLQTHVDKFETFYSGKYQGRRITWQHSLGNCILKGHFPLAGTKELVVSQYQAMVLVSCFNTGDGYTISQIMEKTGIQEKSECEPVLISLCMGKDGTRVLCKKDHDSKKTRKSVHPRDIFLFNNNFSSKLNRIKITSMQMKETASEREQTHDSVSRDRLYWIDAAIVRIMKARKTMDHQNLLAEVMNQLKFPVAGTDVKKRIESLIEREYMERSEGCVSRYNYLA